MTEEDIARICHEANRAYCQTLGDHSQLPWDEAPGWQKASALDGVRFHRTNPHVPASASHDNWMKTKLAEGWVYGDAKDAEAKTHPCIVAFEELPRAQQAKDHLFQSIVHALAVFLDA
jgi:hypothetical protein